MPFIIPARPPNPWLTTFVDYMNHRREVEEWEAGQPKESGAALSASGAAGGAAAGAGLGAALALPTGGLSVAAGALIGAGAGAAGGAVLGKYTNPRMHPGEGPYAQPGNIAQDNAAIMQGIMSTAGTVAGAFKQAKDIKDRGKWVDEYLNYVFGNATPFVNEQQQLAAADAFVQQIPEEYRADVGNYYRERISQAMPSGPSPPPPSGIMSRLGAQPGALPPMPVGGAGPMRQPTPGMAPAANIPPAYTQQANAIFQQTEAAGMTREYSPRAKEAIKRLDDAVDAIITNPSWRPEEKARAIQMAAAQRAQIRKRASVAPYPPTWEQQLASGAAKQVTPNGYIVRTEDKNGNISWDKLEFRERKQEVVEFATQADRDRHYALYTRTLADGTVVTLDDGAWKTLVDAPDDSKAVTQRSNAYARMMSALRVKDAYDEWTTPTHEEIVEAADKALDYAYGRPAGTAVRSNVLPQWRPTGAPQQPPIAPGAPSQPPIAPVAQPAPPQPRPPMTIEQARARAEAILAAIENRPPTPAEIEELKQLKAMGVK